MSDTSGFGIVPRYLRGTLNAYEIALYVALSWRADENGISWAGQETLAQDAGMSRRTVQRTLDSLEAKGLVKSQPWANGKGRTSNVYGLKIWAEPVLSERTIKRTDGHKIEGSQPSDQAEHSEGMGSQPITNVQISAQSTGSQPEVPSETHETPAEPVGVRHTDADRRVSQTQRKKTHKNETHSSSPSSLRSEASSEETPLQKLARWPGKEYLATAASRWSYLDVETTWTLTQKYLDEVRAKGWNYSPDGWLKFMEFQDQERERRTRGRAYAPNGVPL